MLDAKPQCHFFCLLLGRVCKLVLAASVVALLDAGVGPQRADCIDVLLLKRCHSFIVYLLHQLAVLLLDTHTQTDYYCYIDRHMFTLSVSQFP